MSKKKKIMTEQGVQPKIVVIQEWPPKTSKIKEQETTE
jgi:hypothetical protein